MRAAFVKPASVLTAANIKRMLDLKFSTDAELRRKEEQMATHLLYYLDDLEGVYFTCMLLTSILQEGSSHTIPASV